MNYLIVEKNVLPGRLKVLLDAFETLYGPAKLYIEGSGLYCEPIKSFLPKGKYVVAKIANKYYNLTKNNRYFYKVVIDFEADPNVEISLSTIVKKS